MERSFKSNLSNCQVVVRFKRIELHKFKFRLQKNNNRSTYERHRKMSNSGPTHTFQTEFVDGSGRVLVDPIEHGEVPTRKKRNGEALADDFAERRRSLPAPPPPPPSPRRRWWWRPPPSERRSVAQLERRNRHHLVVFQRRRVPGARWRCRWSRLLFVCLFVF